MERLHLLRRCRTVSMAASSDVFCNGFGKRLKEQQPNAFRPRVSSICIKLVQLAVYDPRPLKRAPALKPSVRLGCGHGVANRDILDVRQGDREASCNN